MNNHKVIVNADYIVGLKKQSMKVTYKTTLRLETNLSNLERTLDWKG
jgi:hypothetical protein